MLLLGTRLKSQMTRRPCRYNGHPYFKSEWIGFTENSHTEPHVFSIEMSPGLTFETHYHRDDEFQVVTRGDGTLNGEELKEGDVHYAKAFTPYGPLIAGPKGLSYLTIRMTDRNEAIYYPSKSLELEGKKQLQTVVRGGNYTMPTKSVIRGHIPIDSAKGTLIGTIEIPANFKYTLPASFHDNMQCYVVKRGSVFVDKSKEVELQSNEQFFIDSAHQPHKVVAGESGVQLILLQF